MPIRVNNGIEIGTNVAPALTQQNLAITRSHQQKSEWCWAACTRMVLKSFQRDVRQCEVASFLLEEVCCPEGEENDENCNLSCQQDDIVNIYEHFDVKATFLDRTVRFNTIRREIQERGRPVQVCVDWDEGGAHVIVIYGWRVSDDSRFLRIHDSLFGTGEVRFSELRRYRAEGNWTLTWLGFDNIAVEV